MGDIASHPDRFDAETGAAHYRKSLALAQSCGIRPLIAHCHLGLGELDRRTGAHEQAEKHIAIAATMYGEMGMPFWLERAETQMRRDEGRAAPPGLSVVR
jgi:hypothetical protein